METNDLNPGHQSTDKLLSDGPVRDNQLDEVFHLVGYRTGHFFYFWQEAQRDINEQ